MPDEPFDPLRPDHPSPGVPPGEGGPPGRSGSRRDDPPPDHPSPDVAPPAGGSSVLAPALHHEFRRVRADLVLLAEDVGTALRDLDDLRSGAHPLSQRLDEDLAHLRRALGRVEGAVGDVSSLVSATLAGVERLVRLTGGDPSAN